MTIETLSTCKSFEGVQGVYRHASGQTGTEMTFAVFVPPHAKGTKLPVLWYLSGLTCTHANVMEKGEYRRIAAELGMIVVCPDTSPRGEGVPDDPEGKSEEHTSELQSLMRISYAVFCLKKTRTKTTYKTYSEQHDT